MVGYRSETLVKLIISFFSRSKETKHWLIRFTKHCKNLKSLNHSLIANESKMFYDLNHQNVQYFTDFKFKPFAHIQIDRDDHIRYHRNLIFERWSLDIWIFLLILLHYWHSCIGWHRQGTTQPLLTLMTRGESQVIWRTCSKTFSLYLQNAIRNRPGGQLGTRALQW